MSKTSMLFAGVAALAMSVSSASASTLVLDGGWSGFIFAGTGSAWSDDFTFTAVSTVYFAVTDAYCAGDQFSFSVNGVYTGNTSVPFYDGSCSGATFTTDPDFAYSSANWSSGELMLTAGTYTITGTAIASPFGSGGAFAQLSSRSRGGPVIEPPPAVPLPASGLVLLAGIGGLAALRRRKA